jgi:hypothetical protein
LANIIGISKIKFYRGTVAKSIMKKIQFAGIVTREKVHLYFNFQHLTESSLKNKEKG